MPLASPTFTTPSSSIQDSTEGQIPSNVLELVKENRIAGVATAEFFRWRDPLVEAPPRGLRLVLLTWTGVHIEGYWNSYSHSHYAAWGPIPSVPEWLKKRLYDKYTGKYLPQPALTK